MDDDEDELALEREFAQEVHDVLGVAAGESGCGFVDEEDSGFADELKGDVEPLALSAADHFVERGSDLEVFAFVEAEVFERLLDFGVDFLFAESFEAEFGAVVEVFIPFYVIFFCFFRFCAFCSLLSFLCFLICGLF